MADPELGSVEDFQQEANRHRKYARLSGRYALGASALSGVTGTLGIEALMLGGLNVINGVIGITVSGGMAYAARDTFNDSFDAMESAQYYDRLAAQTSQNG